MTLEYAETNGHNSMDDTQKKREAYRQANEKIIDILETLDREQRGRILRTLDEHYADDKKKRPRKDKDG